jgi:hypothetical protein
MTNPPPDFLVTRKALSFVMGRFTVTKMFNLNFLHFQQLTKNPLSIL